MKRPTEEIPAEFVTERTPGEFLLLDEFASDAAEFAVALDRDPWKHDMHVTTLVGLYQGRFYRFKLTYSYNNGRLDGWDIPMQEVEPVTVQVEQWNPVTR